ncbi:MAG: hypothetical protein AAGE59_27390 [Cyanobacteria bacterium P01_F01_bin.86]
MNASPDHLYQLLPAIYRQRDEAQGEPLRSLLRIIAEQVEVVEEDIDQLYQNWFIETCEYWTVPYIADLIGYRQVGAAGLPGDIDTAQGQARNRILMPRREIANTIRYRRRKGTLALLELLAQDVADWPARAVEFYKLLAMTQSLKHPRQGRQTVDLRQRQRLARLNGPFDSCAHTVDVRSIASKYDPGRHNLPSVGLFVWRLKAYSVTKTPAYCLEEVGSNCYTFSVLGNDTPLYTKAIADDTPTDIAGELNVPTPILRHAFEQRMVRADGTVKTQASIDYYGEGKSLTIWAPEWPPHSNNGPQNNGSENNDLGRSSQETPISAQRIIPADLSDWQYRPRPGFVAVDPELGRIVFPPSQLPRHGVFVSYHYGFSADVGGGEYDRPLIPFVENPLIRRTDFKDANQFVIDLKRASPLSDYLRSHLSATTQAHLEAQDAIEPISKSLLEALADDLNELMAVARLYENGRVNIAELPSDLRDQILQEPVGVTLINLNRALLERAFVNSLSATHKVYPVQQPAPGSRDRDFATPMTMVSAAEPATDVPYVSIAAAIAQWQQDQPRQAVIEILSSDVYVEQLSLEVAENQTLQIRAANRQRPVVRLLNWYTSMPDAINVTLHPGSHFILDGLLVTGRGIRVWQAVEDSQKAASQSTMATINRSGSTLPKRNALNYLTIRHSTLVPGWILDDDCKPRRPTEPSLELTNLHGQVTLDRSIVGSLQINQNEVQTEPVAIELRDSVLDATDSTLEAIGAPGYPLAHAMLRVIRSTVFGEVQVHAITLAENSIFEGKITVARSQIGCMRFCAYFKESRTPRRFRCQPDGAIAAIEQQLANAEAAVPIAAREAAKERECHRVRPRFNSTRYGTSAYCQLAEHCPIEIAQGADDESEMGVFHHLYQPQRAANLQARLDEYTPAGMTAAILYAS